MERVIQPPVDPSIYIDSATEPQYQTSKEPIGGWIYLNSQDTPYGTDRTNCQIGDKNILVSSANRMRVLGIAALWYVPNVNPRNNTLTFHSSISGTTHTVTLTERYYNIDDPADITALITDIVTQMNSVSGASGLTFGQGPVPGFPRTFDIVVTVPIGGQFYFVASSDAVAKGMQMYNFERSSTLAVSHQVGPMSLMYTQFVDVKSTVLTKWEKIRSVTTGNQNPVVIRAYIGGNKWGSDFTQLVDYLAFAWKWNEPIYSIDFQFFDQNGDPLYYPNNGKDFMWQITLEAEL